MKIGKKSVSLLLCASVLLPVWAACSEKTVEKETAESPAVSDTDTVPVDEIPETESVYTGLETADMDGCIFTLLTCNWPGEAVWDVDDFTAETYNGTPINDAVYERNLAVQDRLNCVIAENNIPSKEEAASILKTSVTAADGAYQLFVPRLQQYLDLAADGYIMDIKTLPGIDLEREAWVQNSIDGLSILGHSFAVCNEMMTIHKEAVSSVLFNKELAEDYHMEDLYTVVSEGRWTLDYLQQAAEETAYDTNGDGKMNFSDQWGFLYQRDTLDAFLAASGGAICTKDEEDKPLYVFDSEHSITALMKITDFLYNQSVCQNVMFAPGDFNEWMTKKFMQDEAMFMWVRNVNIPMLRTMESDFGILPNPKYDETMPEYRSLVNAWTGAALTVPKIADTFMEENLGLFIETMGAASLDTLATAYYDVMLTGIAARDRESQDMLDIIYANTTYDPGSIGAYAGVQDYIFMAMDYQQKFSSYNAARKKSVVKAIEKRCEKIEEQMMKQ